MIKNNFQFLKILLKQRKQVKAESLTAGLEAVSLFWGRRRKFTGVHTGSVRYSLVCRRFKVQIHGFMSPGNWLTRHVDPDNKEVRCLPCYHRFSHFSPMATDRPTGDTLPTSSRSKQNLWGQMWVCLVVAGPALCRWTLNSVHAALSASPRVQADLSFCSELERGI